MTGVELVGLSLAELDRWDPDAVHGVFEAATARAEHTRTTATNIGDVVCAVPGSGAAFDAAQQATEDEVRGIKSVWQALRRRAYDEGFTIDLDTNEISYTEPAEPRQAFLMAQKFDRLHADIEALRARANTADTELAAAIRGAAALESPASSTVNSTGLASHRSRWTKASAGPTVRKPSTRPCPRRHARGCRPSRGCRISSGPTCRTAT
jgi:hypothetical protein